jgi:hypothetical protein
MGVPRSAITLLVALPSAQNHSKRSPVAPMDTFRVVSLFAPDMVFSSCSFTDPSNAKGESFVRKQPAPAVHVHRLSVNVELCKM